MSNKTPLFICLAALYNHQNHWTENLMQCFLNQDYEGRAELYLIDDRPGYPDQRLRTLQGSSNDRGIYHLTYPRRFDYLMAKYTEGLDQADIPSGANANVCVLDDDDIYLEHFLSDHAKVLEEHPWSYPRHVFSAYGGTFQREESAGRFWASSAYRLEALHAIGGYGHNTMPWFDQDFLSRLRKHYGDEVHGPDRPGYIYNWSESQDNHTSFYMGDSTDSWYRSTPASEIPTTPLVPRYNEKHRAVMQMCQVFRNGPPVF